VVGRLGQERALEALGLGLAMRYPDYHVFALGPAGVGKHATVLGVIQARAAAESVPHDVCYVHCFEDERHPRLLRVAAGRGAQLREGVQAFVRALASAIPEALARKDTRSRRAAIAGAREARREQAVTAVRQQAAAQDVALMATPNGFALAPVVDGEPLGPEQFAALPPARREAFAATMQALERQLATALFEAPQWIRQAREQSRALDRAVIAAEVADAMASLASNWADVPEVRQWLDDDDDDAPSAIARRRIDEGRRRRYVVNVIVDRSGARGAPVVYVDHPTLDNLVGRIEARLDAEDPSMDVSLVVAGGSSLVQVALQPSPSRLLPSSQNSPAVLFSTPSPQTAKVQSASHAGDCALSSHSSPAVGFSTPSPHIERVQSTLQVADSPASSHCSPASMLRMPSPHEGTVQSALQVGEAGPSSQISPAVVLSVPSPHCARVQLASQVADSPASSHSSSGVAMPSPHGVVSMPSPMIRLSMPKLPFWVAPPMLRPKWMLSMRSGADTPQKLPAPGSCTSSVVPSAKVMYA
jgi:hypothetical protein